jgi:polyhydroxyalkanoate synthase
MPAAMHSFYLRAMYQENRLATGDIELLGTRIDLTRIRTPSFLLSTREDHIAPWKSTFAATRLYRGPVRFVLAASGHIAGVVNPPAANKYRYWISDVLPPSSDGWMAYAKEHAGSWWPLWADWLKGRSGGQVTPPRALKKNAPAPGAYVLETLATIRSKRAL